MACTSDCDPIVRFANAEGEFVVALHEDADNPEIASLRWPPTMEDRSHTAPDEPDGIAERPRDEYHRWRDHRVAQMSVATGVLVTLALAQLGYQTSRATIDDGILLFLWRAGIALAAASIVGGVAVVWTRLQDFRFTATLNRRLWEQDRQKAGLPELRVGSGSMPQGTVEDLDCKQRILGRLTWWLFRVQAVLWVFAVVAVAAWAWLKA